MLRLRLALARATPSGICASPSACLPATPSGSFVVRLKIFARCSKVPARQARWFVGLALRLARCGCKRLAQGCANLLQRLVTALENGKHAKEAVDHTLIT